jgi:hypothetical protein
MPSGDGNQTEMLASAEPVPPEPHVRDFYIEALRALDDAQLPYLVGGGYAMAFYTGIRRNTKDLDIFVRPGDHRRVLNTLAHAGFRTEYFYPFWIAKALPQDGDDFIDILYNSGNGLCVVDDDWFKYSTDVEVLGYATKLCPVEEQLWSKAFVQDRDRYDGADVAHLILHRGRTMDWQRLLRRFHGHERVLLAHCILFGYVYPTETGCVPDWVLDNLHATVRREAPPSAKLCRGPFIAQKGYTPDLLNGFGFIDARLKPHGPLTCEEVEQLPKE